MKLDSKHEAASSYMEAAKCYQKTDKKGARLARPTQGRTEDARAGCTVGASFLYNNPVVILDQGVMPPGGCERMVSLWYDCA